MTKSPNPTTSLSLYLFRFRLPLEKRGPSTYSSQAEPVPTTLKHTLHCLPKLDEQVGKV